MIDLTHLEHYRENNRIEAKKALGGLPHSIWETYSAFANTLGGIILLGVEEYKDKSLHTVDLPDPEKLVKEFWDLVNDPKKASMNILSGRDVTIETVNGDHIIVINVPRADRTYKPVYVEGSPLNSYRRNGEGDYKCTSEELHAMYRDASVKTQDMLVLENMDSSVFCAESIRDYRRRIKLSRPDHAWQKLGDEEFLTELGAMGIGGDGKRHPTAAGLLMFGYEHEIVREYPHFSLDYREEYDDTRRQTDRIISSSGDWSGNVFDFYCRVCGRLLPDIKTPPEPEGINRAEETPVCQAVREALANCLVNADYYGRQGLVILKKSGLITMTNPGCFRIEIAAARGGGVSDPRNGAMLKMFNMIDIGERTGSGIPNIFRVWTEQGWAEPVLRQSFAPDRTVLSLPLGKRADKKTPIKRGGKRVAIKSDEQKTMIIEYLTDRVQGSAAELSDHLGVSASLARKLIYELLEDDIIVAEGENRNRTYRLKA